MVHVVFRENVSFIQVKVMDRHESHLCSSINDPHMRTLDGRYAHFSHLLVTDVLVVRKICVIHDFCTNSFTFSAKCFTKELYNIIMKKWRYTLTFSFMFTFFSLVEIKFV